MKEEEIIERLAEIFSTARSDVRLGIGDDAAIVTTGLQTAFTTDMAVEGVHFKSEWSTPEEIGGRAAVENLADIYAMGAEPTFLVVSVALTGREEMAWIKGLAHGIQRECEQAGASVVGGDIVRGDRVTISIAALGAVENPIRKDSARIGDSVYISGLPGFSRAGFEQLQRGFDYNHRAIAQFKKPTFDYELARIYRRASSMRDISDSFLTQAQSMTSTYAFEIDASLFEKHPDFHELEALAREMGFDVWEWILGGGEDHLLLATGVDLPGLRIGRVVEGAGVKGLDKKKAPETWRHF